jgi:hypothetical protein
VFFADDGYRTPEELVYGEKSAVIRRTLEDGNERRIVKSRHDAAGLQALLAGLGWNIEVHETSAVFYWGSGVRGA